MASEGWRESVLVLMRDVSINPPLHPLYEEVLLERAPDASSCSPKAYDPEEPAPMTTSLTSSSGS